MGLDHAAQFRHAEPMLDGLSADEKMSKPFDASNHHLIAWMASDEARSLLQFDAPLEGPTPHPAATADRK
jgi:hypothetical protein